MTSDTRAAQSAHITANEDLEPVTDGVDRVLQIAIDGTVDTDVGDQEISESLAESEVQTVSLSFNEIQ